jgi:hypothetical protein
MSTPITFEDLAIRNQAGIFSPEKLSTLKRVFDTLCLEAAIPMGAKSERNALAHKLVMAASTAEDESLLMVFGRNAVSNYRR